MILSGEIWPPIHNVVVHVADDSPGAACIRLLVMEAKNLSLRLASSFWVSDTI